MDPRRDINGTSEGEMRENDGSLCYVRFILVRFGEYGHPNKYAWMGEGKSLVPNGFHAEYFEVYYFYVVCECYTTFSNAFCGAFFYVAI